MMIDDDSTTKKILVCSTENSLLRLNTALPQTSYLDLRGLTSKEGEGGGGGRGGKGECGEGGREWEGGKLLHGKVISRGDKSTKTCRRVTTTCFYSLRSRMDLSACTVLGKSYSQISRIQPQKIIDKKVENFPPTFSVGSTLSSF